MKERIGLLGFGLSVLFGIKLLLDKQDDAVTKMKEIVVRLEADAPQPPAVEPPSAPAPKAEAPKEAPKSKKLLRMHTADWCGWCRIDKSESIPRWREQGYTIEEPVDHTDTRRNPSPHPLPWYEITDENGNRSIWIGSLRYYKR